MMIPVDDAWESFNKSGHTNIPQAIPQKKVSFSPKCSDIYISTKTKIAYLNTSINLMNIFWNIPVLLYQDRCEGVIKKQMKVNCLNEDDIDYLEEQIEKVQKTDICIEVDILKQVKKTGKIRFKDTRKINIGLSKKDLCTFRKKKKGAFYNCFVLMMRIWCEESFKEVHVKVFNTGKLEIPGVRDDLLLTKTLHLLIKTLQPFHDEKIYSAPHIVSIFSPEKKMHTISKSLSEKGVFCSLRNGYLRVSLAHYNDQKDIDKLLSILEDWGSNKLSS